MSVQVLLEPKTKAGLDIQKFTGATAYERQMGGNRRQGISSECSGGLTPVKGEGEEGLGQSKLELAAGVIFSS